MKKLLKQTLAHFSSHNATRMGAALSYYAILSFIPLLVIVIMLSTFLFNKELVEGTLNHYLQLVLGNTSATYIEGLLQHTSQSKGNAFAGLISGITIILGALGVFSELDQDLNELWQLPKKPKRKKRTLLGTLLRYIQAKLSAFSLIPLIAIGLLLSIGSTFILAALQSVSSYSIFILLLIKLLQIVIPLMVATGLIALTYRILPDINLPWPILLRGALSTAVLLVVGNIVIGVYLKVMLSTATFGAAGSLVGLLVWIFYSSQVFFLGATFTFVYAKSKGAIASRG